MFRLAMVWLVGAVLLSDEPEGVIRPLCCFCAVAQVLARGQMGEQRTIIPDYLAHHRSKKQRFLVNERGEFTPLRNAGGWLSSGGGGEASSTRDDGKVRKYGGAQFRRRRCRRPGL